MPRVRREGETMTDQARVTKERVEELKAWLEEVRFNDQVEILGDIPSDLLAILDDYSSMRAELASAQMTNAKNGAVIIEQMAQLEKQRPLIEAVREVPYDSLRHLVEISHAGGEHQYGQHPPRRTQTEGGREMNKQRMLSWLITTKAHAVVRFEQEGLTYRPEDEATFDAVYALIESSGEKRKPGTLGYHDVDEFYPEPAPPIRVTREWIGKLIHEGYLCGAYNDNQERFVSMLREKGIEVEEKG